MKLSRCLPRASTVSSVRSFDSFADQFETSDGGSIKPGHEEHEAMGDGEEEQEQIVKQKRD